MRIRHLLPALLLLASSGMARAQAISQRSEEHTSELQSPCNLVCRLLLEKKKKHIKYIQHHSKNTLYFLHLRNVTPSRLSISTAPHSSSFSVLTVSISTLVDRAGSTCVRA